MRADPKPPVRAPRTPKPLKRSVKPIGKRKKKRVTVYKTPRCVYETPTGRRTCKKPQQEIERCLSHAKLYLDQLRRPLIVKDYCEINHRDDSWVGTPFPCGGALQDNHGFPRGIVRTRWAIWNGFSGCSAVNRWAFSNKHMWNVYLVRVWGSEYASRANLSVSGSKPVYESVLASLRGDPIQSIRDNLADAVEGRSFNPQGVKITNTTFSASLMRKSS